MVKNNRMNKLLCMEELILKGLTSLFVCYHAQ